MEEKDRNSEDVDIGNLEAAGHWHSRQSSKKTVLKMKMSH